MATKKLKTYIVKVRVPLANGSYYVDRSVAENATSAKSAKSKVRQHYSGRGYKIMSARLR